MKLYITAKCKCGTIKNVTLDVSPQTHTEMSRKRGKKIELFCYKEMKTRIHSVIRYS